jgi:hypothetical protein
MILELRRANSQGFKSHLFLIEITISTQESVDPCRF